jgi:hypothetical protein
LQATDVRQERFSYVPSCLEIGQGRVKATATFLGSLAAIISTAAAQATDFPAQARAVGYVKVCPQYGAGFGYVSETEICTRNMGAATQQGFDYTVQLGASLSVGLSAENGGAAAARDNSRVRGKVALDLDPSPMGRSALTVDNGSRAMPDLVANLRVDQSWGSAMLKAALRQNPGDYTPIPAAAGLNCIGSIGNTNQCDQPDGKLGWAIGASAALNIPGLPADSISLETNYAQGAPGYTWRANQSWRMWGDGRSSGPNWTSDSQYRDGTNPELARSWGFAATGEHRWDPQWRTSVYGGYERVDQNGRTQDALCSRGGFAGSPSALAGLSAGNCGANFSWWNIGTRTQWNPHPFLDIGLDVVYHRLNRGAGAAANDGARAEDQDHLSAMFRIQYNLP